MARLVLGPSAVVGCSSLCSRVKPVPLTKVWFQLALACGRAVRSKPPLFVHVHWRDAVSFPLLILLQVIPNSGQPVPYFGHYKRPSISLIPAPLQFVPNMSTPHPKTWSPTSVTIILAPQSLISVWFLWTLSTVFTYFIPASLSLRKFQD